MADQIQPFFSVGIFGMSWWASLGCVWNPGIEKADGKSIQFPIPYGFWITIINENRNKKFIHSSKNFDYYRPCDIMIHLNTASIPLLHTKQTLKLMLINVMFVSKESIKERKTILGKMICHHPKCFHLELIPIWKLCKFDQCYVWFCKI